MDHARVGASLRAIRRKKGWTLRHAAEAAGVSASAASRLERGQLDSLDLLNAYARALGARVDIYVRWQGGDLDRLLNSRHSALHERMASLLLALPAWQPIPEVSFSIYGERGVIDWVAWHAETRTLLIVELKSQLVDVQDLIGSMHRRIRLAPAIAAEYGWKPQAIGAWVAFEDGRTNRRHVASHATVLRAAFPEDGRAISAWLRRPDRAIRCLSFLPNSPDAAQKRDRSALRAAAGRPDSPLILPSNSTTERLAGFVRSDRATTDDD